MDYYFSKILTEDFDTAIEKVSQDLKKEGFGILTQIDIAATLKKKLNVDFKKYTILGACNPQFAYEALKVENKIGTMLPCNVIVQELDHDRTEVSAVNPTASMMSVKNKFLGSISGDVGEKLKRVIDNL